MNKMFRQSPIEQRAIRRLLEIHENVVCNNLLWSLGGFVLYLNILVAYPVEHR